MAYESYLPPEAVEEMIEAVRGKTYDMKLETEDFAAVMQSLAFAWRISVLPQETLDRVAKLINEIAAFLGVDIEKIRAEHLSYLNKEKEE